MTLQEILSLEVFSSASVGGGYSGLQRTLKWVNIIEILDDISLLQEGEFLITTAFGIANNPYLQEHLVNQLHSKGLCGLAIQTGYYLENIPPIMLQRADELAFPVIELPKELSFAAITKAVMQKLINREFELLSYSQTIHKRLTDLVLNNANMEQMANVLYNLVNHPVGILDANYKLLAASPLPPLPNLLLMVNWPERFAVLAKTGLLEQLLRLKQPLFIPADSDPAYVVAPVLAGDEVFGYIVLATPTPLNNIELLAVEHSATVLALVLTKEKAVVEVQDKMKGDFFDELLHGVYESSEAVANRARYLGLSTDADYGVMIIDLDNPLMPSASDFPSQVQRIVKKALVASYHKPILKNEGNSIVIFLTVDQTTAVPKTLAQGIHSLLCKQFPQITLSIGIGSIYNGLDEVAHSYREARQTLKILRMIGHQSAIASFAEMGIYNFILDFTQNQPAPEQFFHSTVAPLIRYDQSHKSKLAVTLRTYLESNLNAQATARKLFIHRNTLEYRLKQIIKLTGKDPELWQDRMELELAMLLAEMYGSTKINPC